MKKRVIYLFVSVILIIGIIVLFFINCDIEQEKDYSQLLILSQRLCREINQSKISVYICDDYVAVMPNYESGIVGGGTNFYFPDGSNISCCTTCNPQYLSSACKDAVKSECNAEKVC